ncbi:hypothetical protein [Rosenbergiella epipactidis]|nr:hypothetical protein [Rosenbergiella epipactidis]
MSDVKATDGVGKTQRHRNHRTQWTSTEITFMELILPANSGHATK